MFLCVFRLSVCGSVCLGSVLDFKSKKIEDTLLPYFSQSFHALFPSVYKLVSLEDSMSPKLW